MDKSNDSLIVTEQAVEDKRTFDGDTLYRTDQLNWRDDGDEVSDPSMNDYLKGYNINPYEFTQWAKAKHKDLEKTADREVVVMQFTPEFLADRILTLWNGADGPLQDFFVGFTNRYNNKLKLQVAQLLEAKGYIVYPHLVDDKPRYARLKGIIKKASKTQNVDAIMCIATAVGNSDSMNLYAGELADLKEAGNTVTLPEAAGIIDYYCKIYPEDYALKFTSDMMNDNLTDTKIDTSLKRFQDFQFSNETLDKIEDYMSGNADPMYVRTNAYDGYDFVTDMRGMDGTRPTMYETTASKKKLN